MGGSGRKRVGFVGNWSTRVATVERVFVCAKMMKIDLNQSKMVVDSQKGQILTKIRVEDH